MLKYDRIDIFEGIDINKCAETSAKCSLCKLLRYVFKNNKYAKFGYY